MSEISETPLSGPEYEGYVEELAVMKQKAADNKVHRDFGGKELKWFRRQLNQSHRERREELAEAEKAAVLAAHLQELEAVVTAQAGAVAEQVAKQAEALGKAERQKVRARQLKLELTRAKLVRKSAEGRALRAGVLLKATRKAARKQEKVERKAKKRHDRAEQRVTEAEAHRAAAVAGVQATAKELKQAAGDTMEEAKLKIEELRKKLVAKEAKILERATKAREDLLDAAYQAETKEVAWVAAKEKLKIQRREAEVASAADQLVKIRQVAAHLAREDDRLSAELQRLKDLTSG